MLWSVGMLAAMAWAGSAPIETLEGQPTGAGFVEAFGAGLVYSVNGQILFPVRRGSIGLRAGGSYWDFGDDGFLFSGAWVRIPVGVSYRAGHRPWAFEVGMTATPDLLGGDWSLWVAPRLGVDHRGRKGLMFGIDAQYDVIIPLEGGRVSGSMVPWGGVRLGYWFPHRKA